MIHWTGNIRTSMNITILNNYKKQPSAPLHPLSWPKQPWSRPHLDFTGPLFNHNVPCSGGCPHQIDPMPNSTSFSTIHQLRTLFTQFGIHRTSCVLDNVPSSPSQVHAVSNGLAECAVQVFKGLKNMKVQFLTR